ncbi:phospholipid-transporting ATPase IC [Engraulis encrasicolus]|uniref:phospholipid-transporting ATPase IC n=1 Tax=Engraulis encrasicolus TaxID=184585 RepID=UPI002FD6EF0D
MAKEKPSIASQTSDISWEVRANAGQFHRKLQRKSFSFFRWGRYADNTIRSHKYTPLNFLPYTLYEQFQRFANFYFLLIVVMQCVPVISTIPWYTTVFPLLIVLAVRALKDLISDMGRRRSDKQINSRACDILTSGSFQTAQWRNVCVGDILRIHKDQIIPADVLLLCSTEPHSLCYVETADIDGETNLKFRQALAATHNTLLHDSLEQTLSNFNGVVFCEEPNGNLYSFRGELRWQGQTHRLDTEHILLRGTALRNTDLAYGLTIYAGADTKIMKNIGKVIVKTTKVEKILNRVILGIMLFVLLVDLLLAVGSGVFEYQVSPRVEVLEALGGDSSPAYRAFLTFWGYVILLSPAIPMSLYITFEVMKVIQCFFINWDLQMYHEESDRPAHARNTSLNEELGQVGHLLSDKTGTLTQNRLLFRQCCIAGDVYGDLPANSQSEKVQPLDLSWNRFSCGGLQFWDQRLVDRLVKERCPQSREFFTALALCHTVMTEWKEGAPHYQAASPDEEALVGAARELGWVFLSRTRDSLTVSQLGHTCQYQLLTLVDFTSDRRRMSVLVREPGGDLKLYCKGADTVILERLRKDCPHRESSERALDLFAQGCLRTLCVAVRSVSEAQWGQWSQVLEECQAAEGAGREARLEELHDSMEQQLTLLGVTAIEDRLQDGVPETIATLRQAGIKVWVLTGDKTETAVNVGYACRLMDPDTSLLQGEQLRQLLQSSDPDVAVRQKKKSEIWSTKTDKSMLADNSTIVINGLELAELLAVPESGSRFVALANQCASVLCCRVTPGQKAQVVQLVRRHTSSVTLSIGDGANDVNMIKTSHVGVGLYGVEGSQAVQNADYALGQFRFLGRLLLVHGHWSSQRICLFLRVFLFKTTSFALVHVWYSFFSGFSSQRVYESWFISLYTVMYTSIPVQCLAVFEQDVSAEGCVRWPEMYQKGRRMEHFGPRALGATLLYSLYASLVLCLLPLGVFQSLALDYQTLAVTIGMAAVFTATAEVAIKTKYWTKYNVVALSLSLLLYFVSTLILHSPRLHSRAPNDYIFPGASINAFREPVVWLTVLLTTCAALLPSMLMRALDVVLSRSNTHRVRSQRDSELTRPDSKRAPFQRGAVQRRSSYAVSQGKGFGRLITSGAGLRSTSGEGPRQPTPHPAGAETVNEHQQHQQYLPGHANGDTVAADQS